MKNAIISPNEKLNALIHKHGNNDFANPHYTVTLWNTGEWVRKVKFVPSENAAAHECSYDNRQLVKVEDNPEYIGFGHAKKKMTYLEWEQEVKTFKTYQHAKDFVLSNIKELWEQYKKAESNYFAPPDTEF
jgi:hypothetical protein